MKALVYTGTETLEYRDEPEPQAGEGESLVQVDAAGICGSDMHAWHGHDARRVPPLVLGHELAGLVLEGPLKGQRVAINPLVGCDACRACWSGNPNLCAARDLLGLGRAGGFAETVVAPSGNLLPLADSTPATEASLMEPVAVSVHAIALAERVLRRPISEANVLVIGGGAIGLLAALILKAKGVHAVTVQERHPFRVDIAANEGFRTLEPGKHDAPGDKFDIVIDAVGAGATRAAASQAAMPGGVIMHVGLQNNAEGLDTRRLTLQEITFIGTYCYTHDDIVAALSLIENRQLGTLNWLDCRHLEVGGNAFHDLDSGASPAPKIVLLPNG